MLLTIDTIAKFTQAQVVGGSQDVSREACGITWDSREVRPGFVYVALPGERVDGHDFVASACKAGAIAVLVMKDLPESDLACARSCKTVVLIVASTQDVFTELARGYRSELKGRIIGITGSTGKTTTKNLVRDVLSAKFSCVATKANQNNELGVPRTLLNADPETEMVVVEMGMRGLGQIEELCAFVKPDWGLVTNVGESHIELLGSRENIAQAKAELIAALPDDSGVAFLNGADDMNERVWEQSGKASTQTMRVIFDGSGKRLLTNDEMASSPSVWAEDIRLDAEGRPEFILCVQGFDGGCDIERKRCELALRGVHNVSNACSAAAVGKMAGMAIDDVVAALESSRPESGRQEILHAERGFTVINDAYNANPDSMRASLSLLSAMDASGRRFAVLGDMGELGAFARAAHESVGALAARANIDVLICVGELAKHIGSAALSEGFSEDRLIEMTAREEALAFLKEHVAPGDVVLVKASHFMGLDEVAKGLLD